MPQIAYEKSFLLIMFDWKNIYLRILVNDNGPVTIIRRFGDN